MGALVEMQKWRTQGLDILVDRNGEAANEPLTADGWANVLTGLGMANRDKRISAAFSTPTVLVQEQLDFLYSGDWRIARICDRPALDQVRRGFDIMVEGRRDKADDVHAEMRRLNYRQALLEGIAWSRLHGGAIGLLGINDGQDPEMPVNVDRIQSIDYLTVIDRWDITIDRFVSDPTDPESGMPESYQLQSRIVGPDGVPLAPRVHRSRVLRWDGVMTSRRERLRNDGWAHSVITRVYNIVRDWSTSIDSAAHLVSDFSQAVMRIKGLAKMLAEDKDKDVLKRLKWLDMARSVARLVPIDEAEDFERKQTPVTGLPELLDRLRDELVGATGIPEKILFGKATAGLGDQGQSDLEQYHNEIEGEQARNVVPQTTRLADYIFATMKNRAEYEIQTRPLATPTETEISENRLRDAQADHIRIDDGVTTPDEVRNARYGGDTYGGEITIEQLEEDDDAGGDVDPAELSGAVSATDPDGQAVALAEPSQLQAAIAIIEKVVDGTLPLEAAGVLLRRAMPLSEEEVTELLAGAEDRIEEKRRQAEAIASTTGLNPGAPGGDDDGETDDADAESDDEDDEDDPPQGE